MTGLEHPHEGLGGCRLGEQEPLHFLTARLAKELKLRCRLHAFGHDTQAEIACHGKNGAHDRHVPLIIGNSAEERAIHLQHVHWQFAQVGQ